MAIKSKNKMVALLESKEDGIHLANDVLARLWRIILYTYSITGPIWLKQIDKCQGTVSNKKKAANLKGNFTRQLSKDKISWSGLMNGLAVLEFDEISVSFSLKKKGVTRKFDFDLEINRIDDLNDLNDL